MKVLLPIAHGSRAEIANQEVRELAARIEQRLSREYCAVVPAFLEFAEPDIGSGVDHCVKLGANSITVLPYFLSAGIHVNRDIPGQLKIASQRFPNINLNITRHFGAVDGIEESIIDCAALLQEQ